MTQGPLKGGKPSYSRNHYKQRYVPYQPWRRDTSRRSAKYGKKFWTHPSTTACTCQT